MAEETSHIQIVEKFQELRNQAGQIANKLSSMSAESAEHEVVIRALSQLQPDRKCFRLVGEVLVERTVQEVLPAVRSNKEQLDMVEGKLKEQLQAKQAELAAFQEKYKIRIRDPAEAAAQQAQAAPSKQAGKAQGVLV